ncbi:unnamed protein product [Ilex paraguariensis]|uniref:Uncharacterized protein n=1 Tax=Ilex paraguariensis TaxID=185542 RepID=A0ABC8UMZ5_9AQUA
MPYWVYGGLECADVHGRGCKPKDYRLVGRLSIKIPWKKLGWDPIIIILEDVLICACQRNNREWGMDAVERREFAGKKAKLAAAELAKLSKRLPTVSGGKRMKFCVVGKENSVVANGDVCCCVVIENNGLEQAVNKLSGDKYDVADLDPILQSQAFVLKWPEIVSSDDREFLSKTEKKLAMSAAIAYGVYQFELLLNTGIIPNLF